MEPEAAAAVAADHQKARHTSHHHDGALLEGSLPPLVSCSSG